MTTLSINIENSAQRFIREAVESGRYQTESEVIAVALAELKEREESLQHRIAVMRREVEHGVAQLDRGEAQKWSLEEARLEGRRRFGHARANRQDIFHQRIKQDAV